jgi:hypothetical protein
MCDKKGVPVRVFRPIEELVKISVCQKAKLDKAEILALVSDIPMLAYS